MTHPIGKDLHVLGEKAIYMTRGVGYQFIYLLWKLDRHFWRCLNNFLRRDGEIFWTPWHLHYMQDRWTITSDSHLFLIKSWPLLDNTWPLFAMKRAQEMRSTDKRFRGPIVVHQTLQKSFALRIPNLAATLGYPGYLWRNSSGKAEWNELVWNLCFWRIKAPIQIQDLNSCFCPKMNIDPAK